MVFTASSLNSFIILDMSIIDNHQTLQRSLFWRATFKSVEKPRETVTYV